MALAFFTSLITELASKKGILESGEQGFVVSYPHYVFIFPKCSELICQGGFILEPLQPTDYGQKLLIIVLVIILLSISKGLKA